VSASHFRDPAARSFAFILVSIGVVGAAAGVPLATDPFGYNPYGPSKALALALCAASVALGLAIDRDLLGHLTKRLMGSKVAWAAGALWLIIALSTLMSIDPLRSLIGSYPEYQGVLAWLAVTVIACGAASLPWPDSWPWVGRALSVSVTIMGVYALLQVAGADPVAVSAGSAAGRVRATLGNSSNAGAYLLFAAPFVFERFRRDASRTWRAVAGLACAFAVFMVVFSASRGAWLGLIAAAVVWLVAEAARLDGSRRRVAFVAAVAVVVALVVVVLAVPRLEKRVTSSGAGTIEWRLVVWQASGEIALGRPALGWGPNSFRYVYPPYRPASASVNANLQSTVGDPHNLVLSAATSLGIPGALGLLALCALAGAATLASIRERRDEDLRPVALGAALVGGVVSLMFHYATLDTMPILAVALGLLVASRPSMRDTLTRSDETVARLMAVGSAGVLCVALALTVGLLAADATMGRGFAALAQGSPWTTVATELRAAQSLAPWEPTFTWAIGKAAIRSIEGTADPQAYADGQAALETARRALPLDDGVAFDSAYLRLRFGAAGHDAGLTREARAALVALSGRDPNNAKYRYASGLASAALGEFAKAESELRVAIRLAPGNAEYRAALRQVELLAQPAR
jgi:O-antigen ligase